MRRRDGRVFPSTVHRVATRDTSVQGRSQPEICRCIEQGNRSHVRGTSFRLVVGAVTDRRSEPVRLRDGRGSLGREPSGRSAPQTIRVCVFRD